MSENFEDPDKCLICLLNITEILKTDENQYLINCSKCHYTSCILCITEWYKKNPTCPNCRENNTFDLPFFDDYNDLNDDDLNDDLNDDLDDDLNNDHIDYYQLMVKSSEEFLIGLCIVMSINYTISDTEIHVSCPSSQEPLITSQEPLTNGTITDFTLIRNNPARHWILRYQLERLLKTFQIGSIIYHPINHSQIFNHNTGNWVSKYHAVGQKIVKEYAKNHRNVIFQGINNNVLNPETGRWIPNYGPKGRSLIEGKTLRIL